MGFPPARTPTSFLPPPSRSYTAKGLPPINSTLGSLAGQGVNYALSGDFALNVLNVGIFGITDTKGTIVQNGLLELHLGRDGVTMNVGMGGADVSLGTIASAIGGLGVLQVNDQIEGYTKRTGVDGAVLLRSQYGFGDEVQRAQLNDLLGGQAMLARGGTDREGAKAQTKLEVGQRVVHINGYRDGMSAEDQLRLGIVLAHEAYRNGIDDGLEGQQRETEQAVLGHIRFAANMAEAYGLGSIGLEMAREVAAYRVSQAGDPRGMAQVLSSYDTSADYWRLIEDGSLVYDGDGWLKDPNGNLVFDKNGKPIGANGVQGGLQKILGISAQQAVQMLNESKFVADESSTTPWLNSENKGKAITLDNELYAQKYDSILAQYNTLNIYNNLVAQGMMDYKLDNSRVKGSGLTWNGAQPDAEVISYEQYKENNFISGVSLKMLALDAPLDSEITSDFGDRKHPFTGDPSFHTGIDQRAPEGTPFSVMENGKVAFVGNTTYGGNTLVLEHAISYLYKGQATTSSYFTDYMHLQSTSVGGVNTPYSVNDYVIAGAVAGYSGNTGPSKGAHLHSGLYFDSFQTNPYANWLKMQGYSSVYRNYAGYYFDPSLFY